MIRSDKTLSKRHGATSVMQFHDEGYLADAMVNYLALLGWGYDDSQTLFSRDELIEKFHWSGYRRTPRYLISKTTVDEWSVHPGTHPR